MTPFMSSQISKQNSAISTPRLTPLKNVERKRGGIVSKIDIDALEGKIKAIESQISQVQMIGGERRLDKLEKRLGESQLDPNDVSLMEDNDLEEQVRAFEE